MAHLCPPMNDESKWKPTIWLWNQSKLCFEVNRQHVYAGSYHIARLQLKAYLPLFQHYALGKLLDCGCGSIPYYKVCQPSVARHYAVDYNTNSHCAHLWDEVVNLNETFLLKESDFDTVLLTDVIAHIAQPQLLVVSLTQHMRSGGHLILTTPFVYWASEHPHDYFHPTDTALRQLCSAAGLEVVHLQPYGGHADVLLDTLNKAMTGKWSNRVFRLLATLLIKTKWYRKRNEKSLYSYAIGYTLVARKP
ncbi:MAG: class I SAM-dependent methyltransferase [Flavobacteriales bacterium]